MWLRKPQLHPKQATARTSLDHRAYSVCMCTASLLSHTAVKRVTTRGCRCACLRMLRHWQRDMEATAHVSPVYQGATR